LKAPQVFQVFTKTNFPVTYKIHQQEHDQRKDDAWQKSVFKLVDIRFYLSHLA
jgi:hypothetical protein